MNNSGFFKFILYVKFFMLIFFVMETNAQFFSMSYNSFKISQ
jgi:hypothetical protein